MNRPSHARLLGDMPPCLAGTDEAHVGLGGFKFRGDLCEQHAVGTAEADSANVVFSEFRAGVHLTPRASALRGHVQQVVGLRAEEQMVGPNAERCIALMADEHTVRDVTEVNDPRRPVCINHMRVGSTEALRNATVPSGIGTASPKPAITAGIDMSPEAHFERDTVRLAGHSVDSLHESIGAVPRGVSAPPRFSCARIIPRTYVSGVGIDLLMGRRS